MGHIPRIYIPHSLSAQTQIEVSAEQSRYLLRVMRLQAGASVRVFNGEQGEWLCEIAVLGKTATLSPQYQMRAQTDVPDLTLLFAPLKKTRTDFAIEKATELGVRRIQPVMTDYTQSQRVRIERLSQVAVEAAEQTERMDIPEISEAEPLVKVLERWDLGRMLFFCDEAGTRLHTLPQIPDGDAMKAALLIGPEGGFSPAERTYLKTLDFVHPITLGPRILRAETAIVSALTLWQSALGDWRELPYLPEER